MILEVDAKGPMGDDRRLRIEVADDRIKVENLLAHKDKLVVERPLFGYEKQLSDEIDRLWAECSTALEQVHYLNAALDDPGF
jgi:hypothetical protein